MSGLTARGRTASTAQPTLRAFTCKAKRVELGVLDVGPIVPMEIRIDVGSSSPIVRLPMVRKKTTLKY